MEDPEIKEKAVDSANLRISYIKESFDNPNHELDYARKLFLIENCIYGVDIQNIAVQISKLRFFISLMVDQWVDEKKPNRGILSLPNLETKFVAANTLIGLDKEKNLLELPEVKKLEQNLHEMRQRIFFTRKYSEKKKLKLLESDTREELKIAIKKGGFGLDTAKKVAEWNPFDPVHSAGFFDVETMFNFTGGFDVVIGNPPYGASYSDNEKKHFLQNYSAAQTIPGVQKGSLDTFAIFIEQGFNCIGKTGNLCFIVPISITSSDSMMALHKLLETNCNTIKVSSYAVRPQPVFENAVVNTSILFFIKTGTKCKNLLSTRMYRKNQEMDLKYLVDNLEFTNISGLKIRGRYPKISYDFERNILKKIFSQDKSIGELLSSKGSNIYYRTTGGRYFKVITNYSTGSTQEKSLSVERKYANCVGAILSSNLFFWFYQIFSDNLHIKSFEIESFKIPCNKFSNEIISTVEKIYSGYLEDIEKNANIRQTTRYANIDSFKEYKIGKSKEIIDQIDDLICPLYGLTEKETKFIKNYEIEYRMGDETDE